MEGRKPQARRLLLKNRTGPLFSEEILKELNTKPTSTSVPTPTPTPSLTTPTPTPAPPSSFLPQQQSNTHSRRIPSVKDKKDKKRERWLLTRKTWKYMADAGKKLIPDGAQNRPEDIQKCERHFHNLCANEPKFILWRRKASYPGAIGASRNSKRRLKLLLSHSHKGIGSFNYETEESRNADQIIDLLSSYLKLDESIKITTLLGSKTVRPDQTSSPSAQRPGGGNANRGGFGSKSIAMSSRGPGFLPPIAQPPKGINALSEIDQLLERLRTLSRSSTCRTIIPLERITPEILEDKALLKQIYNELKKQQLHRIIGKHSSSIGPRASLPHASSLSSLWHFRRDGSTKGSFSGKPNFLPQFGLKSQPQSQSTSSAPLSPGLESNKRIPPSSLDLPAPLTSTLQFQAPIASTVKKTLRMNVTYATSGTQTNFIQLNEIERLAKDYKEMKQEEAAAMAGAGQPTDEESDKSATAGQGHRRKSSIDNEDVSQSVSDTIKRYLRMARKKSVHDDNANRFKRVNYDRNLRNIRAKGEINPPGMDEGCNKATQTLDAWSVISLDFIRGHENNGALEEAHLEWRKSLDQRIQQKQEYENNLKLQLQRDEASNATKAKKCPTHTNSSASAPTSPINASHGHVGSGVGATAVPTASGILHSSTQFLSNLWHGTGSHHQNRTPGQDYGYHPLPGSNTSSIGSILSMATTASGHSYNSKGDNSDMQKSKSSSNVGQFVSKKIFKTRSKSQTRTSSPTKAEWTPQGNCTWTSDNGRQVTLTNSHLQNLTEVEAKILQRVAIEKINQLNIGVSVAIPLYSENAGKAQKRRPLAKKKAMTTSFFDIGRKEDKGSNISIFGNTLEDCVAQDQKRRANLTAASDRGSRNSITSLFRVSSSNKVRSCESLPSSSSAIYNLPHSDSDASNVASTNSGNNNDRASGNGNLVKTTSMLLSPSQWDVRRSSQDYEESAPPPPTTDERTNGEQAERQVPTFVQECIKHLEKYGLHSVGIFRVSTSKKRVREMREEFDRSSNTFINPETCPHDVATLLKEFLRDLPEPLLCRNLYKAFIKTQKIRNRRLQLEALSHLVQLLPTAHRDTLFVLLRFLAKVASCCDDVSTSDGSVNIAGNKMDSNNLATVFAPNILRSSLPGEENKEQESMGDVINVIRTMIDHYEELFRVQAELMDEIYANMIDTFPEQLNYLCERRNVAESFTFDDIDSGGSNTPLNSPPPTGVLKNGSDVILRRAVPSQQQQQNQFSNDPPPDGRTHSESFSSVSPRVPPIPTSRRIYTRDDVMHGNAVSKGDPPQDGSRCRSSKSKYAESESSTQQRLLSGSSNSSMKNRLGSYSDSSNTPISTTTTTSAKSEFHSMQQQQQQQQQHQQQQQIISAAISPTATKFSSDRRFSSPYLHDKTRVVTASLKIPVQIQATKTTSTKTLGSNSSNSGSGSGSGSGTGSGGGAALVAVTRDANDDDEVFFRESGQFDLSNIPYIEDSTTYGNELGNCIEGFPITGSISFGGGVSAASSQDSSNVKIGMAAAKVFQIPIAYKNQQIISSSPGESGDSTTSKQTSFLSSKTTAAIPSSSSSTTSRFKEKKTSTLGTISSNVQQKLATSTKALYLHITTVSDSQTGEMEQRLPTSISNIGGDILRSKTADFERMATPSATTTTQFSSISKTKDRRTRNVTPGPSEANFSLRGTLYKRQELISSAKKK